MDKCAESGSLEYQQLCRIINGSSLQLLADQPSPGALSGVADTDFLILQNLPDKDLAQVCLVNKYVFKLCKRNTFWQNRLLHGANVHADNDAALKDASERGHVEVVKVLLQNGANVQAGDDYPLRWASGNGHGEVVKILKEYM